MSGECIYVIGEPESSMVKIGTTNSDPEKRLREIQWMCPVRLVVRWTHAGGFGLENKLHRHFAPLRSHGEWFDFGSKDPVDEIKAFVAKSASVKAPRLPNPFPVCATCSHASQRHSTTDPRECRAEMCSCISYVMGQRVAA